MGGVADATALANEFNIEVLPVASKYAGMESSKRVHPDTRRIPLHVHSGVHFRVHVHPKVISGQSSATLPLQRNDRRLPCARLPIAAMLLLSQRPQFTAPFARNPLRYWVGERARLSTVLRRKRKDVEVSERKLLDESHGLFMIRCGLAGKARNDICSQADSGHGIGNLERPGSVRLSRMPSLHTAQDRIGATLQRHM